MTTTDDVASALIALTASVASFGQAEAVTIPIALGDGKVGNAELVIGVGNDVLSAPTDWSGEEPDFSAAARDLRGHRLYPGEPAASADDTWIEAPQDAFWDIEMDGFNSPPQ